MEELGAGPSLGLEVELSGWIKFDAKAMKLDCLIVLPTAWVLRTVLMLKMLVLSAHEVITIPYSKCVEMVQ